MKKLYSGIIVGIFLLSTFLALNIYNSTSYPGFGNNEACNNCHNQPAFIKNTTLSFAMNNFTQAQKVFSNGQFATDEVPVIQTNNRSSSNIEFIQMTFLKNSSDIMVMAQVPDSTPTPLGTNSAVSDKFGIIFNIDVENFTVGDFLTSYNSTQTNLDLVLKGQMAFTNGHADLWYADVGKIGLNATGLAQNDFISTGVASDGGAYQNLHVSVWYGNLGHGSVGYRYYFVRALADADTNDAQFLTDGVGINYAIASWDNSSTFYHHSSFDQMVIVGQQVGGPIVSKTGIFITNNVTMPAITVTEAASISSSVEAFTVVIILAVVAIAVPIVVYFIRPKTK